MPLCANIFRSPPFTVMTIRIPIISVTRPGSPPTMCMIIHNRSRNCSIVRPYALPAPILYGQAPSDPSENHASRLDFDSVIRPNFFFFFWFFFLFLLFFFFFFFFCFFFFFFERVCELERERVRPDGFALMRL